MQKTKYDGIYKEREGVLLNLDNEALKQYKASKQRLRKSEQMEKDVEALKSDLQEIKELLRALVK